MLKVRQSYHGTGGSDGYRFSVHEDDEYIGELNYFPFNLTIGDVVEINAVYYTLTKEYDSKLPEEEVDEVVYYELEPFIFNPKIDLGSTFKL